MIYIKQRGEVLSFILNPIQKKMSIISFNSSQAKVKIGKTTMSAKKMFTSKTANNPSPMFYMMKLT